MQRGTRFAISIAAIALFPAYAHAVEELFRSLAPAGGVAQWTMSPDRSFAVYYDTSWNSLFAVDTSNPGVGRLLIGPDAVCDECQSSGPREIHVTADGAHVVVVYSTEIYAVPSDGGSPALRIATGQYPRVVATTNPAWLLYEDRGSVWKVRVDGSFPAQSLGNSDATQTDEKGHWVYLTSGGTITRFAVDSDETGAVVAEGVLRSVLEPVANVLLYKTRDADSNKHLWVYGGDGSSAAVEVDPSHSDTLMGGNSFAISPGATKIAIAYRARLAEYSVSAPEAPLYELILNESFGESSLPAYSPDGRWLVFADFKKVYVRDQRAGTITAEIPIENNTFRPPVFSPFGDSVALYDEYRDVMSVYRLDATSPVQFRLRSSTISAFAFLPDGKHITYADERRLWLAGLDGSPPIVLRDNVYLPMYATDYTRVYYREACCDNLQQLFSAPISSGPATRLSDLPQMTAGPLQVYAEQNANTVYFSTNDRTTNSQAFFSLSGNEVRRVDFWVDDRRRRPLVLHGDCYYSQTKDINAKSTRFYISKQGEPGSFVLETPPGLVDYDATGNGIFYVVKSDGISHVVFHGLDGSERELLTLATPLSSDAYLLTGLDESTKILFDEERWNYYLLRPSGAVKLPRYPIGISADAQSIYYARTVDDEQQRLTTITSTPLFGTGGEALRFGPFDRAPFDYMRYCPQSDELLLSGDKGSRLIPLYGAPGVDVPGRAWEYYPQDNFLLFGGGTCGDVDYSLGLFRLGEDNEPVCLEMPMADMAHVSVIEKTSDGRYAAYFVAIDYKTRYVYSVETSAPFTNRLLYTCDEGHGVERWQMSADGKSIAFEVESDAGLNQTIYTANLDGSGVTARSHPVQFAKFITWNNDGILFQGSYDAPTYDRIFLARIEGGGGEGEGEGEPEIMYASADVNRDLRIDLGEVLRVVQLYNAGEFHCEAGSEDGYGLGGGDRACAAHTSDYAPRDWRIGLSELLRAVQLYRNGGYVACVDAGSEDGFCVAP